MARIDGCIRTGIVGICVGVCGYGVSEGRIVRAATVVGDSIACSIGVCQPLGGRG